MKIILTTLTIFFVICNIEAQSNKKEDAERHFQKAWEYYKKDLYRKSW